MKKIFIVILLVSFVFGILYLVPVSPKLDTHLVLVADDSKGSDHNCTIYVGTQKLGNGKVTISTETIDKHAFLFSKDNFKHDLLKAIDPKGEIVEPSFQELQELQNRNNKDFAKAILARRFIIVRQDKSLDCVLLIAVEDPRVKKYRGLVLRMKSSDITVLASSVPQAFKFWDTASLPLQASTCSITGNITVKLVDIYSRAQDKLLKKHRAEKWWLLNKNTEK